MVSLRLTNLLLGFLKLSSLLGSVRLMSWNVYILMTIVLRMG